MSEYIRRWDSGTYEGIESKPQLGTMMAWVFDAR